jgi:hypothetical protein
MAFGTPPVQLPAVPHSAPVVPVHVDCAKDKMEDTASVATTIKADGNKRADFGFMIFEGLDLKKRVFSKRV